MAIDTTELCYTPATALRALLDRRAVSAVEVTEAVLDRARTIGADLGIFAVLRAGQALAEARAADARRARGAPAGPLDGIPLTVKDNLPSAGDRMTNGSLPFAEFVTPEDCALVARLRGAGAVLVGKTNLPEFAHRVLTDSPLHGVTRSPWNRAITPGGSSGGASAAVAAGIAPLAVGTDGGGSIRCPAACTGIVGLKPTLGRIPFEIIPDGFVNFAFAGPMTRTVGDLALMYAVMAGPAADDPHAIGVPEPALPDLAAAPDLRGLRVGWCERFGTVGPDAETGRLTRATVDALANAGAQVAAVDGALFADVFDTYAVLATTAHAGRLTDLLAREGDRITPSLQNSIRQGGGYSAVDLVQAGDRRTALFRGVQKLFERFDVLATPTLNALPKPLDAGGAINTAMYAEWAAYLYPFNLTGHPALSVPCGFSRDGLPVGLQLVGRWYDEAALIGLARWVECHRPWAERRPALA